MLQVQVKFVDDLHTENMLKTAQIPCLCKIAKNFEIDFLVAYPQVTGIVTGWDYKELALRVGAGAGGEYPDALPVGAAGLSDRLLYRYAGWTHCPQPGPGDRLWQADGPAGR